MAFTKKKIIIKVNKQLTSIYKCKQKADIGSISVNKQLNLMINLARSARNVEK